jgi:hypothetical protein
MTRLALEYIEYAVGMAGDLVALVAYGVKARGEWHRNPVGQFLVTLGVVVGVWYAKGLVSHNHNTSTWNLVFYGLFALLFVYMGAVFVVVLHREEES